MTSQPRNIFAAFAFLALIALVVSLAGCGGSGGGVSSQVVTGTAAVGAALSGQVSLKDSSAIPKMKSTEIASDGSFAIDVTDMKAPFVLQASGSAGGTGYKLHSFAAGTGTANVNPLTDIAVASAAGVENASDVFDNASAAQNETIGRNIGTAVATLMAKLQPLLKQYNADNTNPITAPYTANHLGIDGMFDNVKITVTDGVVSITMVNTGAVVFSGNMMHISSGVFNSGALPPVASAPAAPTGVTATGGTNQVTLSWSAVSGATSYNVYYATTSGVTPATGTKMSTMSTSYMQMALTAGTTYYYVVTAVNSAGESAASAQVSATTAAAPAPTVPAAPMGGMATGGTNQVTLSWNAVGSATSYNIYYATASGVTKATGTKIAGATSPAVLTGLAAGTTYYLIVTAVNGTGESAASGEISAKTLSATPTAPSAPTGVTATGGTNQVTVSWSAVSGATSYNVYWSTASGVTTATGTKIAGAATPYLHTGLAAGTTYYYVVTAVNGAGESAASAQASAATVAAAPAFDALAYYNSVCLGCHGSLGPRTAAQISSAITTFRAMNYLSTLTPDQISAIAAVSY